MSSKKFSIKELLIHAAHEDQSSYCVNCRSPRVEIERHDLPEKAKNAFKELLEMDEYKQGARFLYCKKCNDYSIHSQSFSSYNIDLFFYYLKKFIFGQYLTSIQNVQTKNVLIR